MTHESPDAMVVPASKERSCAVCVLLFLMAQIGGCVHGGLRQPATQPAVELKPVVDLGQKVRLPSGVYMSIPAAFTMADAIDSNYALVFRDGPYRRVAIGGSSDVRMLHNLPGKSGNRSVGLSVEWSPDGRKVYDFNEQIIETDIPSGTTRELTAYHIRWYPRISDCTPVGWPRAFYYDAPRERLIYRAYAHGYWDWREIRRKGLMALSVGDCKETVLIDEKTLPPHIYGCDIAIEQNRVYVREKGRITIWTLEGSKVGAIAIFENERGEIMLSPDRRTLLMERIAVTKPDPREGYERLEEKGFCLVDIESGKVSPQLDWGHSFRWSPKGDQIAFLERDTGLWIYDLKASAPRQLVAVQRSVGESDRHYAPPAWSRDGRMLAAGLCTLVGPRWFDFAYHTVVVDFETKKVTCIPEGWDDLCWAPDASLLRRALARGAGSAR
jgi:hypothetical protein